LVGTGKAIAFFLLALLAFGLFMAILNGGGGMADTTLTATISANDTIIPVVSTNGFLSSDYIYIGNEEISYSSDNATAFLGCTRGYGSSSADSHTIGAAVYTGEVSSINQALGFNIGQTITSFGVLCIIIIPVNFLTLTIPRMIAESATFLSGGIGQAILGTMWLILIAGFIICLAIILVSAVSAIWSMFMNAVRRPA
jgi:hypothetical protein